ncbi:MAG TPA: hypothetical protein PKA63_12260 [Oligoflexia bacterium]|nr:hypothetical protein [Oligoflexia bacterium]HMP49429.1 hypothetical protein [Oligoflexia bacterium]
MSIKYRLSRPAQLCPLDFNLAVATNPLPSCVGIGGVFEFQQAELDGNQNPSFLPRFDLSKSLHRNIQGSGRVITFPEGSSFVKILGNSSGAVVRCPDGSFVKLLDCLSGDGSDNFGGGRSFNVYNIERKLKGIGSLESVDETSWRVKVTPSIKLEVSLFDTADDRSEDLKLVDRLRSQDPNTYLQSWTFTDIVNAAQLFQGNGSNLLDFSRQAFQCLAPRGINLGRFCCTSSFRGRTNTIRGVQFPEGSVGVSITLDYVKSGNQFYLVKVPRRRYFLLSYRERFADRSLKGAFATDIAVESRFYANPASITDISIDILASQRLESGILS